jgi:hypothetical protein
VTVPVSSYAGLSEIVVTTAGSAPRDARKRFRSRRRTLHTRAVLARYHERGTAGLAWIELFLDRIVARVPRVVLRVPPVRDLLFAWVVEAVADDWGAQFTVMRR